MARGGKAVGRGDGVGGRCLGRSQRAMEGLTRRGCCGEAQNCAKLRLDNKSRVKICEMESAI